MEKELILIKFYKNIHLIYGVIILNFKFSVCILLLLHMIKLIYLSFQLFDSLIKYFPSKNLNLNFFELPKYNEFLNHQLEQITHKFLNLISKKYINYIYFLNHSHKTILSLKLAYHQLWNSSQIDFWFELICILDYFTDCIIQKHLYLKNQFLLKISFQIQVSNRDLVKCTVINYQCWYFPFYFPFILEIIFLICLC